MCEGSGFGGEAGGFANDQFGIDDDFAADAMLVRKIRNSPSRYYVNLHTAEFPAGAVRGQLTRVDD